MGAKTRIDWCDATWNPVTGCLHGCEYCYARRIAERFGAHYVGGYNYETIHEANAPWKTTVFEADGVTVKSERACPYPFDFEPTFHRYKLDELQHWKKPRTIFVCSMADMFGGWVPDEWIEEVFAACAKAPQHRYMFLTKNPKRYMQLVNKGIVMPNTIEWWYGYSMDGLRELPDCRPIGWHVFVSVEPLLKALDEKMLEGIAKASWIIIGAETGNRKGRVVPEKSWIMPIVWACSANGVPIFMKESLRGIMGDDFRQEFPWEV